MKTLIRSQWNQKLQKWIIVKQTRVGSGGWAVFGSLDDNYNSRREADEMVKYLIETFSDLYAEG